MNVLQILHWQVMIQNLLMLDLNFRPLKLIVSTPYLTVDLFLDISDFGILKE